MLQFTGYSSSYHKRKVNDLNKLGPNQGMVAHLKSTENPTKTCIDTLVEE